MLKNICLHAGPSLELILLFEHLWYGSQAGCFVAFKKQNLTRSKKQRLKKLPTGKIVSKVTPQGWAVSQGEPGDPDHTKAWPGEK